MFRIVETYAMLYYVSNIRKIAGIPCFVSNIRNSIAVSVPFHNSLCLHSMIGINIYSKNLFSIFVFKDFYHCKDAPLDGFVKVQASLVVGYN
jgi:hypothetical protein